MSGLPGDAMVRQKRSWLVTDGDQTPVGRVARRTLRMRLEAVWAEARAAASAEGGPESVHRLRVATRRTIAAFDAFSDLVPAKRRAWFEKRLRQLRRAAGDARDLDVLTGRLQRPGVTPRPAADRTARGRLVAMLARQRDVSRRPIHELYERLTEEDWQGRVARLLDRIPDRRGPSSFGRYARRRFRPMVERFFEKSDRRLRDAEAIHRLRIEGKKLRYALEIFAGAFPAEVRDRCEDALAKLQTTLGEFTDHAAAADRFRRWSREESMRADRGALADLERREDQLADEARKVFVKWWKPARRRELRRVFAQSLRRRSA